MKRVSLQSDQGSILPLVIGCCVLALALILGVASATSLYVERKRLLSVADGAALVAAQSFDVSLAPQSNASGVQPQLSNATVIDGARRYFSSVPAATLHGATLVAASTPDTRTAVIRVRAAWLPPVISYFFPSGIPLEAESSARSIFAG
jgi:hypothetical protein